MTTPTDPAAMFRTMLTEWEKMANSFGGEALKTEQVARSMGAATNAAVTMQQHYTQGMEKVLAAANLPSRRDIEDLSERMAVMEATLARIEAAIAAPAPRVGVPTPSRGRKPPAKAG